MSVKQPPQFCLLKFESVLIWNYVYYYLVNQRHNKKLGRFGMLAITQTGDEGMHVITRGCSQMSRVTQKLETL